MNRFPKRRRSRALVAGAMTVVLALGWTSRASQAAPDVTEVVFWHNQTMSNEQALQEIVDRFNQLDPQRRVTLEYGGDYGQIYQKIMAAIQANGLPNMAVAYESMVSEYARADVTLPLDEYVSHPEFGLAPADLEDIFPAFLETNRYRQFGNKLLSFPFAKSILMMYYNIDILAEAGYQEPPRTWDEFIEQCRAIKSMTGKPAYALAVDASTVNGTILSLGGKLFTRDGKTPLYDQPAAVRAFQIIETLKREELCYQIASGVFDDVADFTRQRVCFMLRTSASRPFIQQQVQEAFDWDMAIIPQADPASPVTVLSGPNICIFRSSDDEDLVSWQFAKHFTSTKMTALWAMCTGYVPVRQSAAHAPVMQIFFDTARVNKRAFDNLKHARPEANLVGWEEIRSRIENAEVSVLAGKMSAKEAAGWLNREVACVLADI